MYTASSQGSGSGPGLGSSSEGGETTTAGLEGASTTVVAEGSSGGSSGGGGSGGSSSSEGGSEGMSSSTTTPVDPDTGSTTESLPTARSCNELLDQDPSLPTGVYAIVSTSDGTMVDVYCDMTLDGGGWTLVARSAPGGAGPFGWGVSRGTLGDEAEPYALDAIEIELPFREILVARVGGFALPMERAYVVDVPEDFLAAHGADSQDMGDARTVLGECNPAGGPSMLSLWGYTNDETSYFFRDIDVPGITGLFPDELRAYFDGDCVQAGVLNHEHGGLFVR